MSDHREASGRQTFLGLAAVILGGLLFAAGVMVGRQLQLDGAKGPVDPLKRIDQRDRGDGVVDGGNLLFHQVLSEPKPSPPLRRPNSKSATQVETSPDAGVERSGALPDAGLPASEGSKRFSLQVASYREHSQAQKLVEMLSRGGYPKVYLVRGEVGSKGIYHRVRLGPFSDRREAEEVKSRLELNEKLEALLVIEE